MGSKMIRFRVWFLTCITLFQACICASSASKVKLENNGYTGLVIAINPNLAEDANLIQAIKDAWTNASGNLFAATGGRAYFQDITILLPKTWATGSYPAAGNESYDQADTVIASPNPSYGYAPYTVQYEGCGRPGLYTHFTPGYLLNDTVITNYGPRGKVIVHEWAHYRWGVFDETSDENPFYWDPTVGSANGPEATRCPRSIYGEVRYISSANAAKHCDMNDLDPATNLYPENCVFFPYEDQYYHPNASLMSYQFMDEVATFCRDESEDIVNAHNVYAPNDQNRLCNLASTWSVITSSEDFSNGQNPPISVGIDTTPSFSIVRTQIPRFVLVLDVSGSMNDPLGSQTKLDQMNQAAAHFITVDVPIGSAVGVVVFSYTASTICYVRIIEDDSVRDDLLLCLPTSADGGTGIGAGIREGITALAAYNQSPGGGYVVVLTDGEENQRPYISEVYDEPLDEGVIVDTVYFGTDENEILSRLSIDSGGDWYFADELKELIQAFSKISSSHDGTTANVTFQIQSLSFSVSYGEVYQASVAIDATIGLNTVFAYTWSFGALPPNINIQSPKGCYYTNNPAAIAPICPDGSIYIVDSNFLTIRFTIPGTAAVGTWLYTITTPSSSSQDMSATVSSMAADNDVEPIIVESGMSATDIADGSPALIYAQVTQGYNPVLNAYVVATVSRPADGPAMVELFDSGAGADVHADDGIYTRYFTNYSGQGRYSVEVEVKYLNITEVTKSAKASRANYRPGLISADGSVEVNPNGAKSPQATAPNAGVESEDLGEFSRVVSSGGFSYSGSATPLDTFPPSRVTDLRIEQADVTDFSKGVVLTFTAPGDDYDSGTASQYEVRYTFEDPTSLVKNFVNNSHVNQTDLLQGNLNTPHNAGSLETIVVNTPDLPADQESIRLSFSIRARDAVGNTASPSNVAVINYFIAPLVIPTVPATTEETTAAIVESTTTAKPAPSKSTTIKPPEKCETCEECDPNQDLYKILTVVFGSLMLVFLTSTAVLSAWLSKVNKQLKRSRSNGNVPMDAWKKEGRAADNKVVPVLSKSSSDGRPVIAYVPESEVPKNSVVRNPFTLDF